MDFCFESVQPFVAEGIGGAVEGADLDGEAVFFHGEHLGVAKGLGYHWVPREEVGDARFAGGGRHERRVDKMKKDCACGKRFACDGVVSFWSIEHRLGPCVWDGNGY